MQAMNASVRNAAFAPAFFGTPFVLIATAVLARFCRLNVAAWLSASAGLVYLFGGMILTMAVRETDSHAAFKAALLAEDEAGFPISMETLAPIRCASIAHTGSYMQIDHAMGRLFTALAAQDAMAPDQRMIAVFHDDPDLVPLENLRSRACSPVAAGVTLAPPIEEAMLRGGLYARLRYQGPYADMKGAYRWLLGVWLPQSGHEPDDAPVFEAYLNSPQQVAPNALVTDIHLPLRAS